VTGRLVDQIRLQLPGAHVLFTTRRGGVSTGPYESLNLGLWTDDDPEAVGENRARVAAAAGISRQRFAQGRQEHGTAVRRVGEPPEGIGALREAGAAGPLAAAIGPGAGPCCYEVGEEVHAVFADVAGARRGRHLDLRAVARARLAAARVRQVEVVERCTMCEPQSFFSHRRDGGVTGRQAGVAWRR
jgi:polyphenol oxidase